MTGTRQRTVTKEQLDESWAAWDAGEFSDEWKPFRHLAAMQAGIIYPPEGTKFDNWGDDSPSQRAMLIRAIRETPEALKSAIRRTRRPSWSAVIEVLLGMRDEMAGTVQDRERHDAEERDRSDTQRQASNTLRRIGMVLEGKR